MFLSLRNLRKKKGLTLEDAAIKLKIKKIIVLFNEMYMYFFFESITYNFF